MDAELRVAVERYLSQAGPREELDALRRLLHRAEHDALAQAELRSCMTPLAFGTAGLRAPRGPGPGRMNGRTVEAAVRATLDVWSRTSWPGNPTLVVGWDARIDARAMAELAARVIRERGRGVLMLPGPCPTPLVSFAVRRLGAQGGFMLTASHNPPEYGGLKVFGAEGAQIVEPFDRLVEVRIRELLDPERAETADRPTELARLELQPMALGSASQPNPFALGRSESHPADVTATVDMPNPESSDLSFDRTQTDGGVPAAMHTHAVTDVATQKMPTLPVGMEGVDAEGTATTPERSQAPSDETRPGTPGRVSAGRDARNATLRASDAVIRDALAAIHTSTDDIRTEDVVLPTPMDPPAEALATEDLDLADLEQTALLGDQIEDAYVAAIAALGTAPKRRLKVAYTALHGVGARLFRRVVRDAGHDLVEVEDQNEPDGLFPTAPVPNPEAPEALQKVLDRARLAVADLALAHDPDADRLAVAAPRQAGDPGGFVPLDGNAIGGLLAVWLLQNGPTKARPVLLTTQVSSRFVDAVGRAYGARVIRTPTGFKHMARQAERLPPTEAVALAYEEALGYSVLDLIRDKDGLSAGRVLLDAAASLPPGLTLWGWWSQLQDRLGGFAAHQMVLRMVPAKATRFMERLRSEGLPVGAPFEAAGPPQTTGPEAAPTLWRQDLSCGSWLAVRPSGTEPKLKIYYEAVTPAGGGALRRAQARAEELGLQIRQGLRALAADTSRMGGGGPPWPPGARWRTPRT